MTSAEDIRDFYNDTFFQDGKAREAQLDMTIVSGASSVRIHNIKVGPGTNLDAIFRAYYAFLKANGPVEADAEPRPDKDRLIDFEVVTYKGKRYFIEERPDELFVVRKENGEVISDQSPTTRAIVKQYKESKDQ